MPVSVQENVPARTEFIIYPNPFQNEIMVRTSLQTDNLESGIYLYEIRGQQQMVKRVILN